MSAGLIGLALGIGNVGALLGAFSGGAIARRLGNGPAIVLSAITFSVSALLIPAAPASTPLPFLMVSLAVMEFGSVVYNVNQVGLRQAITPERMLGRMNATMRFIVFGTMPIGAVIGGAMGGAIGLRPTLWIAAGVGLLAFLPVLLSPVRSLRKIEAWAPEGPEAEPPQLEVPAPVPVSE
jgi:MFS family permease